MDSLHLCIALGPVAVYLLLLGMINVASRPFLTTGARDTAALGICISGFVIAGPMELFLPETAAGRYGAFVWLLLIAFYALSLSLLVLLMRPRIIVYNVTAEQLRPLLVEVVNQIDRESRWAGESLMIPRLGVQLHLEAFAPLKNMQLVAAGPKQNYAGWRHLEMAIAAELGHLKTERNPYGYLLLSLGLLMVGVLTFYMVNDSHSVAQGLRDMLRM